MLVPFVRLLRNQLNAVLSTIVDIFRHPAVRRIHLLELIQTITNRFGVPPYVAFAGKWVENERRRTGLVALPEVSMGIPRLCLGSGRALRRDRSLRIGCCWLLSGA